MKQLFAGQQQFDVFKVSLVNLTRVCKISLTFGCFFCQDVALKCMFTLDLSCSGQRESLLCTRIRFHFWHFSIKIYLKNYFLFFGEKETIILFPSSLGSCSTLPYSSRSFANLRSRTSPCSLNRIDLPLKKT
jgi:hypothetical protein